MKYDFTTILDRQGKDALAIDGLGTGEFPDRPEEGFDAIPMWVADMYFEAPPSVSEAIVRRCSHGAYGYFLPRDEYYEAIMKWQTKHPDLRPEHIGHENGVLGGVISALNVFCQRGDKVLLHSPTYVGFTSALKNNGYDIIHSPLKKDANGIWRMDFEDMERLIVKEKIHATIFCSPHNPTGRVWEREEIAAAMELFRKYDVSVISDEIWSDLILTGHEHIPTQSISEDAKMRTVALYAPSKTFNLAGLVGSYHVIYNRKLRESVEKEGSLSHYNAMNVLSMYGLIGGYSDTGREWLEELRQVLTRNVRYVCDYLTNKVEGVSVAETEGTYMLFPDFTGWCEAHRKTIGELEKELWRVGVAVQDGRMFHGPCHIRMNLAHPLSRIEEAVSRMDRFVLNK